MLPGIFGLCAVWVVATSARSQTPAPLQEWQYSSGVALIRLFEPDVPKWRTELGASLFSRPLYEGSQSYREMIGPVIDIRYRDIAFASVGEGLGVNIWRGENYRAGVALGYDLGRRQADDLTHLRGLGDIGAAPVVRFFGSYVISKAFPLVLRADVRRSVGGTDGLVGDLDAYLPLPGSSKTLVMFAGPSVTFADRRYLQREFGVTATQSLASGYPVYGAHAGVHSAGLGLSATRFIGERWLINANLAVNRLLGSAGGGPIVQRTVQGACALSVAYHW